MGLTQEGFLEEDSWFRGGEAPQLGPGEAEGAAAGCPGRGSSPTLLSREQQSRQGGGQSVKHRLLRVVQRLFQYQVLLTGGPRQLGWAEQLQGWPGLGLRRVAGFPPRRAAGGWSGQQADSRLLPSRPEPLGK